MLTSPPQRARHTADLAGRRDTVVDENLREWDYGGYEGLTTAHIHETRPDWSPWEDGVAPYADGRRPGERSPPASAYPSAPPTPTSRPSSSTCPAWHPDSCMSCARPILNTSCSTGPSPSATASATAGPTSQKHRRNGVNVQVVTDPSGHLLWISPAMPGRTHDLTAARTHRIIRICERQGVPILADRAYIGAGPWVTTPIRRLPNRDLTTTQRTVNRALSAARAPVERSIARLKSWRILRRARCRPNRMTVIAAAILTLEGQL